MQTNIMLFQGVRRSKVSISNHANDVLYPLLLSAAHEQKQEFSSHFLCCGKTFSCARVECWSETGYTDFTHVLKNLNRKAIS